MGILDGTWTFPVAQPAKQPQRLAGDDAQSPARFGRLHLRAHRHSANLLWYL
jgi:hypothetical protein